MVDWTKLLAQLLSVTDGTFIILIHTNTNTNTNTPPHHHLNNTPTIICLLIQPHSIPLAYHNVITT